MKVDRSRIAALLILCLTTGASGCASLGGLESPEVTLVQVVPVEATVFETTLDVRLRIANPNPDPITFEGANFKLTLDGRKIGRGMTPETVTVDRFGTAVVPLPFHVSNTSLLLRLREILDSQAVSYGVSGKLYLRRATGTRKVKVQSTGRIDLGEPATDGRPPTPDG
jgi:LEA14-like dessication related protein